MDKKKENDPKYEEDKEHVFQLYKKTHQFTIRLKEENNIVEVVNEMKLLGTILTNDLKWDANTS